MKSIIFDNNNYFYNHNNKNNNNNKCVHGVCRDVDKSYVTDVKAAEQ